MYLSRLMLEPRHRDTRGWLADCHRLHCAIMSGFAPASPDSPRADLGVLYRVESAPPGRPVPLLVQSRELPRWGFETEAIRAIDPPKSLDGLEGLFVPGARFRFRLRANPTRRVHRRATEGPDSRELDTAGNWRPADEIPEHQRTGIVRRRTAEDATAIDARGRGKRVEVRREEERIAWLARRGRDRCGFELVTVRLTPGIPVDGREGEARDVPAARADPSGRLLSYGRRLTFSTALFEGALQVTDGAAFRQAFEVGVGPGKAFGCGLLSLAPAGGGP